MDSLWRHEIPVPGLNEQGQVVELLRRVETLRNREEYASKRLDRFGLVLFEHTFGDPVANPLDWPMAPVASFVQRFEAGKSLLSATSESDSVRYRVLRINAVTSGRYDAKASKPVPPDYVPPPQHVVQAGDVLLSRANTRELLGAVAYVHETPPNVLLPDKLWRFVWREPRAVEPLYVWQLFSHPSMRRELSARATGTSGSMQNISQEKVLAIRVPVPSEKVQKDFVSALSRAEAMRRRQLRARACLDRLFHALMHQAFTGALTQGWRAVAAGRTGSESERVDMAPAC